MNIEQYEKEMIQGDLNNKFEKILAYVDEAVNNKEICLVEKELFQRLQHLGQSLLESFVKQHGTGYQKNNPPCSENGKALKFKGTVDSPYFSIFGEISIYRASYADESNKYYYPLDEQLNLPASKYSYLLQKWIKSRDVETDFRDAVEIFNEVFDFSLLPNMPRRIGTKVSNYVDDFYEQQQAPSKETEGTHLAIGADGKGIRIIKSERQTEEDSTPKARREKGEKPGTKKESVVTVDFSFNPGPREPEEIVKALLNQFTPEDRQKAKEECQKLREEGKVEPRIAINKHIRATLNGKINGIEYLVERVLKRDPNGEKPVIVLIDGDRGLEKAFEKTLKTYNIYDRVDAFILDIIHVSEYIWKAGTAIHGEKGQDRIDWVYNKLLSILQGNVGRVIGGLKQIITKNELSKSRKDAIQKTITYFENHRHMMDYATYLSKGYHIATGLVEGACGSFVKDRMEQSGMRWSIDGAQSILDMRAVKKNNDWDEFWQFYNKSEKSHLYPDNYMFKKIA